MVGNVAANRLLASASLPATVTPMRARAAAIPWLGLAFLAGCHRRASADDCRAMSEHYLDLAVHESTGSSALHPAEVAAVREVERGIKRAEPAFRRVQDSCEGLSKAEVSCAIDARTTTDWEGCIQDRDR